MGPVDSNTESVQEKKATLSGRLGGKSSELLIDGYMTALHARDRPGFHVSRQRVPGGGWFLDTMSNVMKRDPASQFLVVYQNKDTIGLRSFPAGGKLLQVSLLTENGNTKDDLKLPTDDSLLS